MQKSKTNLKAATLPKHQSAERMRGIGHGRNAFGNSLPHNPTRRRQGYGDCRDQSLRFTPYSWAKLIWFRDASHTGGGTGGITGGTEIGGFGVTADDDPLLVIDFVPVKQRVTAVSVEFDDDSVADFFDRQVELGRKPGSFARIWAHTHPGISPEPSATDEDTFERCFGTCDWSVMFILAKGGDTYARLRFSAGPGGEVTLPVAVDFESPFAGVDAQVVESWNAEYTANVLPAQAIRTRSSENNANGFFFDPSVEAMDFDLESDPDSDLIQELVEHAEWEMRMEQLEAMGMA